MKPFILIFMLLSASLAQELNSVKLEAVELSTQMNRSNPSFYINDLKNTNADNIAQAIKEVPGVSFLEATGNRNEALIQIRGFGRSQVSYYLDGIPMMEIEGRRSVLGEYSTVGIWGLEIQKGFVSPLYSLMSAVNMSSYKPSKELEFNINARYLSPNELKGGMSIGTRQAKFYLQIDQSYNKRSTFPLSTNYKERTSDNQTNAHQNAYIIKLKVGFTPNENHDYSINYIYQTKEKGGAGGSWNWPRWDKRTVYLLGTSYFNEALSLDTRAFYDRYFNIINAPSFNSNYDDSTVGASLNLNYDLSLTKSFMIGLKLKQDEHKENYSKESLIKELQTGAFMQYTQSFFPFRILLTTSYDKAHMLELFVKTRSDTLTQRQDTPGFFSYQAALYFDLFEGQILHLYVGKKNAPPSFAARFPSSLGRGVSNANLMNESSINYELGYELSFERAKILVSLFYSKLIDMIIQQDLPSGCSYSSGCYQNINANTGYMYGTELSLSQSFFEDKISISTNYSYGQKRAKGLGKDNLSGSKITNYPNHIFNARLSLKPLKQCQIVISGVLESARYYNSASNTVFSQYEGYTRNNNFFSLDLRINYELAKKFLLNGGVLNLTNRDNYINDGSRMSDHLQGRRYFVGFDYGF